MINKKTSRRNLVLAGNCIQKLSPWRKTKRFLRKVFNSSASNCGSLDPLEWPSSWQCSFPYSLLNLCHHFPANRHPALQESVVSWVKAMSGTKNNPLLVKHFEISASYGDSQKCLDGPWMRHLFHRTFLEVAIAVAGVRATGSSPAVPTTARVLASAMHLSSRWKPCFFPFVMSMLEYFINEVTDVYYLLNYLPLQQSLRVITTKTCTTDVKSHQFKSTYTFIKNKTECFFSNPCIPVAKAEIIFWRS